MGRHRAPDDDDEPIDEPSDDYPESEDFGDAGGYREPATFRRRASPVFSVRVFDDRRDFTTNFDARVFRLRRRSRAIRRPSSPSGTCLPPISIRRTTSRTSRGATRTHRRRPRTRRPAAIAVLPDFSGGHRNEAGRRGVSIGVVAALISVVVVVGVVILWRFFGDALSDRSHSARCVGEKQPVAVIADPSISDQVQHFAERFNAIAAPVGDHCVAIGVKSAGLRRRRRRLHRQLARRTWASGRRCGSRAARYRPRGSPPRRARKPSPTVDRWSPRRWCSRYDPNFKKHWATRNGRHCPNCRPNPTRWRT